jgi:dienelactone hydrolase
MINKQLAATLLGLAACVSLVACGGVEAGDATPTSSTTGTTERPIEQVTASSTTPARPTPTSTTDVATTATPSADTASCIDVSFPSGGRALPGRRCDPIGVDLQAPRPAVVILGGCADYAAGTRLLERDIASSLAADGMTALIVDYHAAAIPSTPEAYCQPSEELIAAVPAILAAVTDAAAWLRTDEVVDDSNIGAVGYSLGGLFATFAHLGEMSLASVPPASFGAIATLAAPMYPDTLDAARAGRMPPLYVVHGTLDDIVPLDASEQLAQAAEAGGTEVTLVLEPAMDHGWSEAAASAHRAKATAEITEFLSTHLRPAD